MVRLHLVIALAIPVVLAACNGQRPEYQPDSGVSSEGAPNGQRDTEEYAGSPSSPPPGWFGTAPTGGSQPGTPNMPSGWGPP